MLNKKRQELIIQNLKSISSQVRIMAIEQLVNLPSMPAQEKIKLIEGCLQDSEDTVQTAAKIALGKLGGSASNSSAGTAPSPAPASTTPFSPSASSSDAGGFELPSLGDIPSDSSQKPASPFNLPNLFDKPAVKAPVNVEPSNDTGFTLPGLNQDSAVPSVTPEKPLSGMLQTSMPQRPVSAAQQPTSSGFSFPSINQAAVPPRTAPASQPVAAASGSSLPRLSQIQNSPVAAPSAPVLKPAVSAQNAASLLSSVPSAPAVSSNGTVIIDAPVDPSLPVIQNSTDIAFLLQHIREIASAKPTGYLTRLFELAKSVHEEVALTALQTLHIQKDDRVAPQVMLLLNDTSYSSQRRFLMLKIVMDTNVPLNADFLENILVNEKDVIIKSGLVKVFAKNCNQDGVPLLIRCLNDDDPRVRANTVEVIESQHITGCEKEIIKMLDDSENRVKVNAAKYLVKIGYQQAFLTLRNMLVSPEVWLRDSVIFALGEIGDQSSLVLLRSALRDPNQGIRLSVLKSLAKINSDMARQILKAATKDPDQVVAQVAISLFERIKDTPAKNESSPSLPEKAPQNRPTPVQAPAPQRAAPAMPSMGSAPSPIPSASPLPSMPSLGGAPSPTSSASPLPSMPSLGGAPSPTPSASPLPSRPSLGNAPSPAPSASPLPSRPSLGNAPSPAPSASPLPQMPSVQKPPVKPVANPIAGPSRPVAAPSIPRPQTSSAPAAPSLPAGSPNFSKPRSAAIYAKLCSPSVDEQRSGMKDVAFVMGQDQMILIEKAISLNDESIRIAAVKILSRRRTPDVKEILSRLTGDSNETIASMAKKSLMLMK